ncbi:hypothetical protein [Streptomyces chartreusis]
MTRFHRLRLLVGAILFFTCLLQTPYAYAGDVAKHQIVFCLSSTQRTALVEAARNLDLLDDSSTPNYLKKGNQTYKGISAVKNWSKGQRKDFDETCSALTQATSIGRGNSPKEESSLDFLNWLLPIIAGAILTLLATELQGIRARRMAAADAIRTAIAAFRDALIDYTTEWTESTTGGEPSITPLDKQRTQLITALRKVGMGRKWPFLQRLTDDLEGSRFRDDLTIGWRGTEADRHLKAETIHSHMTRLEADTEQVAIISTSMIPLWLRPGRKKNPTSVGHP